MFFINSNVYECDLITVTSDIRVNQDETFEENISNAKTQVAKKIMVQKTHNSKYFKEILTKKLIPVYCVRKCRGVLQSKEEVMNYYIPKTPYFIKYYEEQIQDNHWENDLKVATYENIEKYINDNKSLDGTYHEFLNQLEQIFKTANDYYKQAYMKNNYSEKELIKKLMKKF